MQTQTKATPIEKAADVRRLLQYAAPTAVVVDTDLKPGAWYVVRGMTATERGVIEQLARGGAADRVGASDDAAHMVLRAPK